MSATPVVVSMSSDILLLADEVIQAADEASSSSVLSFVPRPQTANIITQTAQAAATELLRKVCGLDTRLVSFFAQFSKMQRFAEAVKQLLVRWEGISLGLHGHCLQLLGLLVDHAKTVSFASVFDAEVIGLMWHYRYVC